MVKAIEAKCYLRELSLVKVKFEMESILLLCKYVASNRFLEELDISHNLLKPKLMRGLIITPSRGNLVKQKPGQAWVLIPPCLNIMALN